MIAFHVFPENSRTFHRCLMLKRDEAHGPQRIRLFSAGAPAMILVLLHDPKR